MKCSLISGSVSNLNKITQNFDQDCKSKHAVLWRQLHHSLSTFIRLIGTPTHKHRHRCKKISGLLYVRPAEVKNHQLNVKILGWNCVFFSFPHFTFNRVHRFRLVKEMTTQHCWEHGSDLISDDRKSFLNSSKSSSEKAHMTSPTDRQFLTFRVLYPSWATVPQYFCSYELWKLSIWH